MNIYTRKASFQEVVLFFESLKAVTHASCEFFFSVIGFFIMLLKLVILFRSSHCQIMTQLNENQLEKIFLKYGFQSHIHSVLDAAGLR